jgi:ectoine hydroxylase
VSSLEKTTNIYPSRQGGAQFIERQDPTVYAPKGKEPPVSAQQITHYAEKGFMLLDGVFSETEIQTFQDELERLRSSSAAVAPGETITEPESGDVRSIFRIHESSPIFKALVADKRLADLARYILDDEVYIHQSRLNYKPGFRGKEFYWHSDFETWHVEDGMPRMRALSMSITLTENFEYNGPLMLIPGSHLHYAACEGGTPDNHYEASLKKQEYGVPSDTQLACMVKKGGIVSAKCKPGSVIIFDCNTMHGSNGNISPEPRSNVFFVYNAVSNQVTSPFCDQPPRPEYICSRGLIKPLVCNSK